MSKDQIRHLIDQRLPEAGVIDTALKGVQLFRVTEPVPCAPAVYEPTVVAILSGVKEAILDGEHHAYGSEEYLLCPMTLPVEAGAPQASDDNPLLGVMIALEPRMMRDLAIEMETTAGAGFRHDGLSQPALALAKWDTGFTEALLRLLELLEVKGARISYHDPFVAEYCGRKSTPLTARALRDCDAALVVTDHDDVDYALVGEYVPLVVDTRNVMASLGDVKARVVRA